MREVPGRSDVVVIGAGIIGLSTAYYLLLEDPKIKVTVIDRGPIGGIASPRAAGSLRHHYSHPLLVEMAIKGHTFFREFSQNSAVDFGYVRNGYILRVDEDQVDWLTENVDMVRSLGVNTRILSSNEIASLFPDLRVHGQPGTLAYDHDAAHVQPCDFMRALVMAVHELGAIVVPGVAVTGIDVQGGEVQGIVTAGGSRIKSPVVLNAAGAWAGRVAQLAGVKIPVKVSRLLQVFELLPSFELPVQRPTISDGPLDLYARINPANRLLVGARHYFESDMNPDDVPLIPDSQTVANTRRRFQQLIPEAWDASIYQAWAGIDGDTPDYQPILGPVNDVRGLILATGFSGHGFKLGPIVGQSLAELIRFGESRAVDISPLSIDRFSRGELFPLGYKQMGA